MTAALRDPLISAWLWLLALSGASTLLAAAVSQGWLTGLGVTLGGAAILALAWAKARVILARYLGLAEAPFWHRGFSITLAIYALLLLGLYLIG
ncbi:nitric oxide reductase F protein [Pseudothioclava nitratireducens]|jgi:hypothetical protein|uniref:nitric oxide reductase F protein n=1 Tax=Pseudothioclava nitratireducens TaxID=1928646 RepID=UPI0023DC946D|nr:nitric oxide reductase F protein [Defluviimonas nitratireducens]MDF1618919.1 nitric oxide reductase F protein [Defluviimonas nitratireducens]